MENQLKETIRLKEKEILDVKNSICDVLQNIRNIAQTLDAYNYETVKRQISEIVTNTQYELTIDEKEELSTTNQSNR